jgi:hypothetical protein
MKYLGDNRFNFTEEEMFNLQINSISGCKVKVGDEYYSVWKEGSTVRYNKFHIDFELTEEEFKGLNIKDD